MPKAPGPLEKALLEVSNEKNVDVILINKPMSEPTAEAFHRQLEQSAHEEAFVILVTIGGDPHAAYMMARDLQIHYKRVTLCVAGDCYSAGTLMVLGAHEVVITPRGRLGPLDIQLVKKDELSERLSGLTVDIALDQLSQKATESLVSMVYELKSEFGRQISFRTALDVSADFVSRMMGEIYKQIDPIRIGEDARSLRITSHYGALLEAHSSNLKSGAVDRLLKSYPSHACVIDLTEAKDLFVNLREPTTAESQLLKILGHVATDAMPPKTGMMFVFPGKKDGGGQDDANGHHNQEGASDSGQDDATGSESVPAGSDSEAGGTARRVSPKRTPRG